VGGIKNNIIIRLLIHYIRRKYRQINMEGIQSFGKKNLEYGTVSFGHEKISRNRKYRNKIMK
jgi:hypothetical protein